MSWILSNLDLICPILCLFYCVLHCIIQCINAKRLNKKIDKLCDKCFGPVFEGEEHTCKDILTSDQLEALIAFVRSIHGNDN